MIRFLALLAPLLLAVPAQADMRGIGSGADLTPADMGHIFAESCFVDAPGGLVRNAAAMGRVFSLEDAYARGDAAVDLTDLSETLRLTVEGGGRAATCTMTVDAEAAGDGADLYESVEAHLVEWVGEAPEADYVDGGLTWAWSADATDFALTFTEGTEAFVLALDMERQED